MDYKSIIKANKLDQLPISTTSKNRALDHETY